MPESRRKRSRGNLIDWSTQRWVQATGRAVSWIDYPWLGGPVGDVDTIGIDFFDRLAQRQGWTVIRDGAPRGLVNDFTLLDGPTCSTAKTDPEIVRFYEQTSEYEFDVWSEWCGFFRPFGTALGLIFSRRLQQLNVPLSSLDTKLGITSEVLKLASADGAPPQSAWVRKTVATGQALYVGSYSICSAPGFEGACIKVAFPLPNGYALVIMKPETHVDGSFTVRSAGRRFGDPGFYFFVESESGRGWARYVAALKESIHVFRDEQGEIRADHELHIWGARFLRLHYRLRRRSRDRASATMDPSPGRSMSPVT